MVDFLKEVWLQTHDFIVFISVIGVICGAVRLVQFLSGDED